jgi:hypothetical protein
MSTFTRGQVDSLEIAVRVSSALSFLGSGAIILSYVLYREFRTPINRSVFFLSIADFLASIAMILGRAPTKDPTFCTAQGWLVQTFLMAALLCGGVITLNLLQVVVWKRPMGDYYRQERYYLAAAFLLPALVSTAILFGDTSRGPVYVDSTLWCWIGANYNTYRLGLFYAPIWILFLFNLVIYAVVGSMLFRASHRGQGTTGPMGKRETGVFRSYMVKAALFTGVAFLNWIWGTINRIQNFAEPRNPIYALFLLHAIFTPLQGAFNSIVYFWVSSRRRGLSKPQQSQSQQLSKGPHTLEAMEKGGPGYGVPGDSALGASKVAFDHAPLPRVQYVPEPAPLPTSHQPQIAFLSSHL